MFGTVVVILIGIILLIECIYIVYQELTDYDNTLKKLGMLERQKEEQKFPLPNILEYKKKRTR